MITEISVQALKVPRSWFASELYYLLAVWLMAGYFPSLMFIFFIWIIGTMRTTTMRTKQHLWVCWRRLVFCSLSIFSGSGFLYVLLNDKFLMYRNMFGIVPLSKIDLFTQGTISKMIKRKQRKRRRWSKQKECGENNQNAQFHKIITTFSST